MTTGVLAALGAALLWVTATRLFQGAGRQVPPLELNLAKGGCALLLFAATLPFTQAAHDWPGLPAVTLLGLSGVIGIGMGDTAYFRALAALGTRRTLLMELLAAPTAAGLSWVALRENLAPLAWLGLALTLAGVAAAVLGMSAREPAGRVPRAALRWGLLAAAGQGVGMVLARAALQGGGLDPALAAMLRLAAGQAWLLLAWHWLGRPSFTLLAPGGRGLWVRVAGAALLGTWLGIWLQQVSLAKLPAGVAQSLLSTAPLFAMLLAALAGRRPGPLAWAGALLAVLGVALLSTS
ncbi:MAG: EamA family transporter [bacterium]|nr:EamA family transporter [bacterium]